MILICSIDIKKENNSNKTFEEAISTLRNSNISGANVLAILNNYESSWFTQNELSCKMHSKCEESITRYDNVVIIVDKNIDKSSYEINDSSLLNIRKIVGQRSNSIQLKKIDK